MGRRIFFAVLIFALGLGSWRGSANEEVPNEPPPNEPPVSDEAAGDEPVEDENPLADYDLSRARPWQKPDYSGQEQVIGYSPSTFAVPPEMQQRVSFWIDVYTAVNTDQGYLHDSQYVHLVYEKLDFTDIKNNPTMTTRQKARARRQRVKDMKDQIRNRLERLQKVEDPASLAGEDLRYWRLFSSIDEPDKYIAASRPKRLRFQLGQSDRFIKGIFYSGRYLPEMEAIFRQASLPVELTRLPFVESSFNVKARSRVGASGIWQFMRSTGRKFVRIRGAVDERNDPLKATEAAAKFLKINYSLLNDWPLAVTAYNHGPAGIKRLLQLEEASSLIDLLDVRRRRFGFASANFYASFLAALEVEKNADRYFKKVVWDQHPEVRELRVAKRVNKKMVLEWFNHDLAMAQEFNPHLIGAFWRGGMSLAKGDFVRLPADRYERAIAQTISPRGAPASEPLPASETSEYRIAAGDTLSEIANQFGVPVRELLELNDISDPRRLRPGMKLQIPARP